MFTSHLSLSLKPNVVSAGSTGTSLLTCTISITYDFEPEPPLRSLFHQLLSGVSESDPYGSALGETSWIRSGTMR